MPELITNFGKNISFTAQRLTPKTQDEVLEILGRNCMQHIRVLGSLHSWSDVLRSDGVALDLSRLNRIAVDNVPGDELVTVGAGCTLEALLDELKRFGNLTLPTLGSIKAQTIAGAVATATHGSGTESLSHYIRKIRIATYKPQTQEPYILTLEASDKEELRAARCSLGYMGVVLSVTLECRPDYDVLETLKLVKSIGDVRNEENEYPLQQFALVPYSWKYYVFRRKGKKEVRYGGILRWLCTRIYRLYKLLLVDVGLHAFVKVLARFSKGCFTRFFYRWIVPKVMLRGFTFTDTSEHILTVRHDLYRHMEMEVLVPEKHITDALEVVQWVTDVFAGRKTVDSLPPKIKNELKGKKLLAELQRHQGEYTYHYVIVCRRLEPDDALISMASKKDGVYNDRAYYTLSFFNYYQGDRRYGRFCSFMGRCLNQLYAARLHWGKVFPLDCAEGVRKTYTGDRLERFRKICNDYDPNGVFRNAYAHEVLGFFPPSPYFGTGTGTCWDARYPGDRTLLSR